MPSAATASPWRRRSGQPARRRRTAPGTRRRSCRSRGPGIGPARSGRVVVVEESRRHAASPSRASVAVESTMSVNRIVASIRSSSSSGAIPNRRALANSTASTRLVADDPGVVAGWDLVGVAGDDVELRPVVHLDVEMSADHVAEVAIQAGRRVDDRPDDLRPAPAGLPHEPPDGRLVELDDVDVAHRELPDLVRPAKLLRWRRGTWRIVRRGAERWLDSGHEDRPRPRAARTRRGALAAGRGARCRRGPAALARPRGRPSPRGRRAARARARRGALPPAVTTLDDHLARGLRVEALRDLVEGFEPRDEDDDARPRRAAISSSAPPILRPPSLRDFYAFEGHVRTMWERRGGEVPEAWYRLPIFYFSNVSEIRGPGRPGLVAGGVARSSTTSWRSRRSSTRRRVDLPPERAEEAIGGYTIFNDWSARDLQRDETAVRLGPAKGKDFASSFGPWLVTPDELADARRGTGFDLAMTADGQRHRDAAAAAGPTRSSRSARCSARASADVAAAPRRPDRQRDGRDRLPARGPRRDARALP